MMLLALVLAHAGVRYERDQSVRAGQDGATADSGPFLGGAAGLVAENREWSFAGCDVVPGRTTAYLGWQIAYSCHARSARPTGGGTAVTVFYTAGWRAAGIEGYGY